MSFDPAKARVLQQLLQQGLTEDQAIAQAGISERDLFFYTINDVAGDPNRGRVEPTTLGPPARPNEVVVPPAATPPRVETTIGSTTTTQTAQITGGGSTTRRVVPTQYEDNATSRAIQTEANDLEAQKQARATAIKAAGGSGADVLRDPEFRRLSNAQTAKEYETEQARTPVPNTGGIVTTVTPGVDQTTTTQTVDGNFVTNRGSGFDPQAQTVDANQSGTILARNFNAQPQPDPFEVDGVGIGLTDEEIFAQDNPVTPQDTQNTFTGPGYGFDYDENGELIPADSAEAARIRSEAVPQLDPYEIDGLGAGGLTEEEIQQQDNTNAEAAQDAAAATVARDQFTLQQRNNTTTQGDWRVRIRLLPGASYLYKDSVNYLMQPLRDSDGVVFPYVPTITTNYVARYDPYELVHANYRGFFYKNSHVGEIQLNGVFTAQDTAEASYLLAVIHFFRSCTKMFYGQDSEFRGSPPPLVELSGYGEFQFNNHPCLVSTFNYTLPNGVDYIRVSPNNQGVNLSNRRNPISTGGVILDSVDIRLTNNNLVRGAEPGRIDLGFSQGVNGTGQTSYVPTKMEIQLTMLPVQTREQVSKGFRLDEFARGNLLRGGFW